MAKRRSKEANILSRKVGNGRLKAAAAASGYAATYTPPRTTPKQRREFALQARKLTPLVIERFQQIILNGKDADAIKAGQAILDRAYGRAPVTVDVTHGLEGEALQEVARAILQRRQQEALPGGGVCPDIAGVGGLIGSPGVQVSHDPKTHVKHESGDVVDAEFDDDQD